MEEAISCRLISQPSISVCSVARHETTETEQMTTKLNILHLWFILCFSVHNIRSACGFCSHFPFSEPNKIVSVDKFQLVAWNVIKIQAKIFIAMHGNWFDLHMANHCAIDYSIECFTMMHSCHPFIIINLLWDLPFIPFLVCQFAGIWLPFGDNDERNVWSDLQSYQICHK